MPARPPDRLPLHATIDWSDAKPARPQATASLALHCAARIGASLAMTSFTTTMFRCVHMPARPSLPHSLRPSSAASFLFAFHLV